MTTQVSYFPARGGVNLAAPPWELVPGELLLGFNYEITADGYRRMDGYERFDGRAAPSSGADSAAMEILRAAIGVVPGSGPVRGVWVFNNEVYAFRDNAGGTACVMHKATTGGWVVVTTPVLSPGGRYEFINHNFYGTTETLRMYGVDGVNKGFVFDGTTFSQITTGMTIDAPTHLVAHANYLIYAFPEGSLQSSPLGEPEGTWVLKLGTESLGMGQEINALKGLTGNVLCIWCEDKIYLLRGRVASEFTLEIHSSDTGGYPGSVQILNRAYFFDDRGLTTLEATDAFGDFDAATFSEKIEPLLKGITNRNIFSVTVREKNQYRLMWVDPNTTATQGVVCGFKNEGMLGFTSFTYPFSVNCMCNGDIDDLERVFAGGADGYVYELDAGYNHDGAAIAAYMRFPFNSLKSPRNRKRFRKVVVEVESPDAITAYMREIFDYNDPNSPGSIEHSVLPPGENAEASGGFWNISDWNEFVWGGPSVSMVDTKISGTGKNISVYLYTTLTYERPYTIQGIALQYDPRRLER